MESMLRVMDANDTIMGRASWNFSIFSILGSSRVSNWCTTCARHARIATSVPAPCALLLGTEYH